MKREEMITGIELARIVGFSNIAAEFPVTSQDKGIHIPGSLNGFRYSSYDRDERYIPSGYIAASDHSHPLPDFDLRSRKGLEKLFSDGMFLRDNDNDGLCDEMNVRFEIEEGSDPSLYEAAANLAFRFGMDTTAYSGKLFESHDNDDRKKIVFRESDKCSIEIEKDTDTVFINGMGQKLIGFVSGICENFPFTGGFESWTDRLQYIIDASLMKNLDGQLAYLDAYSSGKNKAYVSPLSESMRKKVTETFPETDFIEYREDREVFKKEYDISWEVDDLKEVLKSQVYPLLRKDGKYQIDIAVGEDRKVRESLIDWILKDVDGKCDKTPEINVLCSYKQGFSWIEEKVIPELRKKGNTDRFTIRFRPFLKEGETEWGTESGVIPNYGKKDKGSGKWFDMPIRYLQELYPIEDVITDELGISHENVEFLIYEGNEDITYEVLATDSKGSEILRQTYRAEYDERPYLDDFPDLGLVHPSTGYVRLKEDGKVIFSKRIISDTEKVWDIYQKEILPSVRRFIEEKTGCRDLPEKQPFFNKLLLEINLSEPNEKLKSRQDLLSSLDGLHEDLYFAGSDYFRNLGMKLTREITDAPGLILPVIRKREGKPYFKAVLCDRVEDGPCIRDESGVIVSKVRKEEADAWIRSVEYDDVPTVIIRTEGIPDRLISSYASLIDKGISEMSFDDPYFRKIIFETEDGRYSARIRDSKENKSGKTVDINDIDIMEDKVIGYDDYIRIMEQLKNVDGLIISPAAVSYSGQTVYAVEFDTRLKGYVSMTKRITFNPSQIIDSRHHANEVSSTNSAFMLIRDILTDERYRDLPKKLNLAILPMENVDGSAIHYELQKDNPEWKLHVARFNAIGKEFYHELFRYGTIHTEAIAMRRLFFRYLPDVIIDNHGVPSHEWEQQFSGYTSPSYKGFWLPRSLLYGYFFHITGDEYRENIALNRKFEELIADAFEKDRDITDENIAWARQFEKYAHKWMPEMFPADYYKNMINYWIPHEYDPEHRYPSIKFPWIVSVDYVSEVADETAQGEYLTRCARAHLVHDRAILSAMMDARCIREEKYDISDGFISLRNIRKRPIMINLGED